MFILAPIHKRLFFRFSGMLFFMELVCLFSRQFINFCFSIFTMRYPYSLSQLRGLFLFICCIGTFKVHAQNALLEEHFDLPAGAAIRDHGWYAHSASTTNPLTVAAPGLVWTQTPYRGSGQGLSLPVSNTGSDENRPFSLSVDSGAVYAAFMMRAEGVVDSNSEGYFFHFLEYSSVTAPVYSSIATAHRARTYLVRGDDSAHFRLGLTFNSASVPTSQGIDMTAQLDTGTTYLVVLKYNVVSGADNDQVSLFLFADGDSLNAEPATPTLGPLTGTARDLTAIQGIACRQYSATQRIRVDGIYCTREWNFLASNPGTRVKTDPTLSMIVYPNPVVNGRVRVVFPDEQPYLLQLRSADGRLLRTWHTASGTIDVSELPSGLYHLRAGNQEGKFAQYKLLIP